MRSVIRSCVIFPAAGAAMRHDSSQQWVLNVMYGTGLAPRYGSWKSFGVGDALKENDTPVLYCKALVHASGGGRRARDWVAGCSAALFPSSELLKIAMRHNSSEEDVERYRRHLVETLEKAKGPQTGEANDAGNVTSGEDGSKSDTENDTDIDMRLSQMPEVRCFVYDAMRAACFHRYKKVPEEQRVKLFTVAARLGLDEGTTMAIWRLVEKEGIVARDKQRALESPWND
ncbi:hypothetical protein DPX39_070054600 [Trypanosoma brucei equiperdum]|uniref:Uncharacterized protein n=1 Tax=Trypanosoma brucei equiperdum TaxID=630700 RepID=A0A3L6L891_9TRYP|nr:hypothetical protein DPX39_070054600 [Trypanosoma brucei equiperdum]